MEQTLRILSAARRHFYTDWLILRLIAEHGLKIGEIVGNMDRRTKLPGIKIKDLVRDEIFIRRAKQQKPSRIPISSQLMLKLRMYAGTRPQGDFLFSDLRSLKREGPRRLDPRETILRRLRKYAENAGVVPISFEALRNTLLPNQIGLVEFDGDIAGEATLMANFYALNYCLERSIRTLILETLEKYSNWWEQKVPATVKEYYDDMMKRESDLAEPLIGRPGSQLNYLTFGQLKEIIDANWADFERHFLQRKKAPVIDALVDLNQLRNLIAHSCELSAIQQSKFLVVMNELIDRLVSA